MDDRSAEFLRRATLEQLPRIEGLARRRFRDSALTDEAVNFALDALGADEWEAVRRFRGEARFETFLMTLTARLFEDFVRQRFGRTRLPDWVRARGSLWRLVYRLLCMERHSLHEMVEIASDTAPGGRDRRLVEEAGRAIRARYPNCGAPSVTESPVADVEVLPESTEAAILAADAVELQLLADERSALIQRLGAGLLAEPLHEPVAGDPLPSAADLPGGLRLTSEERLLLKLVYQDGLNVTSAGRLLGYTVHQTHGRLRRLLLRIRDALEAGGVDLSAEDFR